MSNIMKSIDEIAHVIKSNITEGMGAAVLHNNYWLRRTGNNNYFTAIDNLINGTKSAIDVAEEILSDTDEAA